MPQLATAPDLSTLEVPIDAWTQHFWEAAAEHKLVMPRCRECRTYRWPPGPFCPQCQWQAVEWLPAGAGRIYSFTIVPGSLDVIHVPALIEFPDAGNVRVLAPIVDTPVKVLRVGAPVITRWMRAANATVPVFMVECSDE